MPSTVSIVIKSTGGDAVTREIKGVGDAGHDASIHIGKMGDASGKAAGGLGSLLGPLGGVAQIAGGFVVGTALTQLPGLIGGLTGAASDSAESMSKAQTIFGDGFKAIDDFAKGASDSVGLSKQKAYEATGTFGNLFVQLGIGKDQAAGMSTNLVGLAADFASFHNADISDVISAQTAAFRGEYDALQRFVPTINAAAVEQEALAQTGKKTTKELTDQEKALAVQALMFKNAGDAAGDFSRTKEGDANKTRILQAKYEDLQATMGAKLLPIQIKVKEAMLEAIPIGVSLGAALADKLAPGAEAVADGAALAFDNMDKLGPALTAAADAGSTLYGIFAPLAEDIFAELGDVVTQLIPPIRDDLVPALAGAEPVLKPLGILAGAVAVGPLFLLLQAVKFLAPWVGDYLVAAIKILSIEINAGMKVYDALTLGIGAVATAFGNTKDGVSDFVGFVKELPTKIGELPDLLKQKGIDTATGFFTGAQELWDDATNGVASVVGLVTGIPEKVGDVAQLLWSKGEDVASGLVDGAVGFFKLEAQGIGAIVSMVTGIPEKVGDVAQLLAGKGADIGEGFIGGIVDGASKIAGKTADITSAVKQALHDSLQAAFDWAHENLSIGLPSFDTPFGSFGGGTLGFPSITVPAFADGVRGFTGGLALVGERGPELVALPRGADVFSNSQSRQMLDGAGGGNVYITMENVTATTPAEAQRTAGNIGFALAARGWARV